MVKNRHLTTPFAFQRIDARRPAEVIAETIAKAVYLFDVNVGEKLPSELDLARRFGVSRTVLRDALRRLVEEEVLRVEPGAGGGAFVIGRPKRIPLFGAPLPPHAGTMADILIARRAIEPQVLRMAASRANQDDLNALNEAIDPARRLAVVGTPTEAEVEVLSVAALRFNVALGRATHVPYLAAVMETLTQWMEPVRRGAILRAPDAAVSTLEQTLRAIELNDFDLIQAALERRFDYLERAWEAESGRRLWRDAPDFLPRR